MEITIKRTRGYLGKKQISEKGYVARITGTSAEYGLSRSFLPVTTTTYDYRPSARKQGWEETCDVTEGMYEVLDSGEKTYRLVWRKADGTMGMTATSQGRAMRIARLMDDGMSYDEARRASKQ